MQRRAAVVLLLAISVVVSGSARQGNAHATLPNGTSASARQLIGTWRLISRVVTLEDGTAVQDPGLGKTPSGYLIYDSSGHMAALLMKPDRPMAIDCGTSGPAPKRTANRSTDTTHILVPTP